MSINRQAAKRDFNEPALKTYAERLGYTVMQVSGKGLPDWVLLGGWRTWLVDVKTKDGRFKPAQLEQWTAWAAKGIEVFIVRKTADIDCLLRGELPAWKPGDAALTRKAKAHVPGVSEFRNADEMCVVMYCPASKAPGSDACLEHGPRLPIITADAQKPLRVVREPGSGTIRAPRGQIATTPGGTITKACGCLRKLGRCEHSGSYAPPQTKRADASALAAETFAPPTPVSPELMQALDSILSMPTCNWGHSDCCLEHPGTAPPAPLRCGCTIEVECAEHAIGTAPARLN